MVQAIPVPFLTIKYYPNPNTNPLVAGIAPGEILVTEYLKSLGINSYRLAANTEMPRSRISGILNRKRAITTETALAFTLYFGTTPELWIILHSHNVLSVQGDGGTTRVISELLKEWTNHGKI